MSSLKEIRNFVGMTQKELAEKSGVNIRQIQRYESASSDIANMTAKNAESIAKALGCTISDLLNLDLSLFTNEAKVSAQSGDLTIKELSDMSKYQNIKKISKIGEFGETFSQNFQRIPESIFDKLTAKDLADLVDALYDTYGEGKLAGRLENN